jgi:hypothetical protein
LVRLDLHVAVTLIDKTGEINCKVIRLGIVVPQHGVDILAFVGVAKVFMAPFNTPTWYKNALLKDRP